MPPERIRILVIDDESDFCFFIKANLQQLGNYDVAIETDPQKGLKLASQYHPDLILLDIMMPGMSGLEVLKKLKANPQTTPIPVLILTAKIDEESKHEAARLYDEAYIEKPVEIKLLKSRIEKVLSRIEQQ